MEQIDNRQIVDAESLIGSQHETKNCAGEKYKTEFTIYSFGACDFLCLVFFAEKLLDHIRTKEFKNIYILTLLVVRRITISALHFIFN